MNLAKHYSCCVLIYWFSLFLLGCNVSGLVYHYHTLSSPLQAKSIHLDCQPLWYLIATDTNFQPHEDLLPELLTSFLPSSLVTIAISLLNNPLSLEDPPLLIFIPLHSFLLKRVPSTSLISLA